MSQSRMAICLYNEEIKNFDYTKFFAGSLSRVSLKGNHANIFLYVRKSDPQPAPWVSVLKKYSNVTASKLQTASAGAILILKVKGRFFGCCFGTSVVNINRENIESEFGLGAVFRRVTRTDLKSVQSFSLSSNPITNQRTSTLPTLRDNFNIDSLSENITELEGYSRQGTNRSLIRGKEFYSCTIVEQLNDLIKLCEQLLLDYQNALVQREFLKLTSSKKVKDKKTVAALNDELCKRVTANDINIFFNDYEHLPDIASYKLMDGTTAAEPLLIDIKSKIKSKKAIDINLLKNTRIAPVDSNGTEIANWSLFKMLFIEIRSKTQTFVLFKSIWYEIDQSNLSNLRNYLDNFYQAPTNFPKATGLDENTYSKKVAAKLTGQLWDQKLFTHPDYRYGVEFCDILTKDYIISAKKYKSSALNSHLLLQTAVSLQIVDSDDMTFFSWALNISKSNFGGLNLLEKNGAQVKKNKTIIIMLLGDRRKRASQILPFFSLVAFKLILTKITNMGFKAKVVVV